MKTLYKHIVVWILTTEARLVLWRFRPFVIAVTGNLGKTSTKDAVYTVLSATHNVWKSDKSMNSETGVPLAIIGAESGWHNPMAWIRAMWRGLWVALFAKEYPEVLVLEVGADHPGDIQAIAKWLVPDISVVTGIPDIPVHVANFASADALAAEKRTLVEHTKVGGWVIVNGDDARAAAMRTLRPGRTLTYGFEGEHDFVGSHDTIAYEGLDPVGMQFRINHDGSSVPVMIGGALGRSHCYPFLVAVAVAKVMNTDLVSATEAIKSHQTAAGRMRIIEGKQGSTIIDDSYNASPQAMIAALDTLESIKTAGRKIGILGDMRELGAMSERAHREVGERAGKVLDLLYTVGEEAKTLAEAAHKAGMPASSVISFGYRAGKAAAREVLGILAEGDVVLVKGSQNKIRLEEAVKELMLRPEDAKKTLVRQEKEWQNT